MDPAGAVCLVTGASSGIGRATASELARRGGRVVLVAPDEDRLTEAADAAGGRAFAADLAIDGEPERVTAAVLESLGRVDVIVNNAGLGLAAPMGDVSREQISRLVAVNLVAPMLVVRALLPQMLERGRGAIVNVGSIAGHVGVRGEAVYGATKGGLAAFTASLREELASTAISVSLVSPVVVATEFFDVRGAPYRRRRPKPVQAEVVARAIVRAIVRETPTVFVPRWARFPVWLNTAVPPAYRLAARRWA